MSNDCCYGAGLNNLFMMRDAPCFISGVGYVLSEIEKKYLKCICSGKNRPIIMKNRLHSN